MFQSSANAPVRWDSGSFRLIQSGGRRAVRVSAMHDKGDLIATR